MIQIVKKILNKIFGHDEIKKMFSNFSWLVLDRIVRLGLNLFIVGWIARYLGREQYGILNYAMSFAGIVGAIASFGTNNIIIREIINKPERKDEILGTSFAIRQFGGFLVVIISTSAVMIINSGDRLTQILVIISSMTYLVGSLDVLDLYFQSQIKSKYAVFSNNASFLLHSAIRIILIVFEAPLVAFAIASTTEVIVAQLAMLAIFRKTGNSVFTWSFQAKIARQLLRDSWPLMLTNISVVFYLRVGQVMLGKMVSYAELGDYSAAVKISEVWYFIPLAMQITIYPKIVEYRMLGRELYHKRLQEFFSLMAFISYGAIVPTFLFNRIFIQIIFGSEFANAGPILSVHIWAGLFLAIGVARDCWCNAENYNKSLFYSTLAGAIANVALNIPLIKFFGGIGAAMSALFARIIAGYFSTFFISKEIFLMQTKSIYLKGLSRLIREDFLS